MNANEKTENQKVIELAERLFGDFRSGDLKPKIQGAILKFHVDQLSAQDIVYMAEKRASVNENLGINVQRSGKGLTVLFGVAQLIK
ncbi:MAG: hypothetical protein IE931_03480 [Sphingobacteriales bacterium]|nr:hypothetical protein [Sphingobacteriales bacterium]